ncbi:type II toxin-antitoxin system HipA family toxin [Ralstonia solanacearum]|uniref:type II toxin-antitoxin system HipA family toxin n=1 Tax=Ralstonia solanacearum TaxID=305 RepID=UPI000E65F892|nr:type II toxin-antitoxin system HipA family toxin [Ralstonia solanacearum]MBT1540088.1 type II toxin-antitoxin system HipA family toxin [Ralstonia solanacearum]QOK84922.1 type II toxin-antitoxin system HipA family toxin [Ralstonia solanacearum]RIJ84134.1 toxin HipA [Ralstonia solanacearum]
MGRRSHTRALGLWMNGTHVGRWELHPHQGDVLKYAASWVAAPEDRPLSRSLPFTPDNAPHRGPVVRAYFENLLPDSRDIRERIARRFQAGTTEAFDLREQIGRDCIGALQVLPADMAPPATGDLDAEPLTEAQIAQTLRETVAPPPLGGMPEDDGHFRISIAGAQEKTAFLQIDGRWYRPRGATPASHIFKLPMGLVGNMQLDLRESVENEWLCALVLRAYGLPVAHCRPLVFEDQKVLAVERFDRMWWDRGKRLIRLPQEDMCQATATPPHLKYEADGGPGIDRIMGLLDGSAHREADRLTLFRSQVLFWMLRAPAGHAKNFSLALRPGGAYALTPLYDVMSAYPLLGKGPGKLSAHRIRLAMAIRSTNAHWKMQDILRRHWLGLGQRYGLVTSDGADAASIVDNLVARTPEVTRTVRAMLPEGFPQPLADSIRQGLQHAADKLAG